MKTEILYPLTDYLLLNAYSLSSPGLNNGKAGVSLSLFEAARFFQDERIEKCAFDLIQESIILSEKTANYSFASGFSGVAFVLLYLIKHKFIIIDFEELLGELVKKVISGLDQQNLTLNKFLFYLNFFIPLYKRTQWEEIQKSITAIIKKREKCLEQQMNKIISLNSLSIKTNFFSDFINYLKILYNHRLPVSFSLVEEFCKLSEKLKFISSFELAYYLKNLINNKNEIINKVIESNEKYGLENLKQQNRWIPLSQRINLLYLLNQDSGTYKKQISLLEQDLFHLPETFFQKNILKGIIHEKSMVGYGTGISRFVLYSIYRQLKKENKDTARFQTLSSE